MKRYIIFSIITLFTCLVTKAQIIVTGTVVDAENEPLIGVNILEEGTTNGNITDIMVDTVSLSQMLTQSSRILIFLIKR